MFAPLFQGLSLNLLDFLANGRSKNCLEGFCSTIELHPRLRNATAAAEYNIVCAAAKIAFAFPVAERHHGLGTWVAEARL
jgi:hypothetical protein